jgi:RNA polymerase sigma factor (sigma-70 family)
VPPPTIVTLDPPRRASFPTTRLTLIELARDQSGPRAREALAILCSAYWYPTYAYIRRLGHSREDAEDLTQGFFARVLEKRYLDDFESGRGRFRSFLLTAAKHFVANERDWARAEKRGGRHLAIPIDDADSRFRLEPRDDLTPEKLFERQWALALLRRVEDRLRAEAEESGKARQFDRLKSCLIPGADDVGYRALALDLEMTEGAVKVAVHRLRRRFRDLLRDEIAQTVADPGQVGDELAHLLAALRL